VAVGAVLAWVLSIEGTGGAQVRSGLVRVDAAEAKTALPAGAVNLGRDKPPALLAAKPTANSSQQVQVPLEVAGSTEGQSAPRITSGRGSIRQAPTGKSVLEAAVGERVILSSDSGKAAAAKTEIRENQPVALPWLVMESVRTKTGADLRTARPFLTLAKAIHWDGAIHRHVAQFEFWLEPEAGDGLAFSHPIDALFVVTCDEVSPARTQIASVGVAAHTTISVSCSAAVKNELPEQQISVLVDSGKLSYPFKIPHRAGPPVLAANQSYAYGLGFGDLALTVSSLEEDGSPLRADGDLPVNFVVSKGTFAVPAAVLTRDQQRASVTAHPRGLGRVELSAMLREQSSQRLTVSLGLPVLPFLAMLLGGAVGGFLVSLGLKTGKKTRRRALTEGVIVGVVTAILSLLIPSALFGLPDVTPFLRSEAGLFAVATLAGLLGTPLLKSIAGKLFAFSGGATA
jgi:hypothetical protein